MGGVSVRVLQGGTPVKRGDRVAVFGVIKSDVYADHRYVQVEIADEFRTYTIEVRPQDMRLVQSAKAAGR